MITEDELKKIEERWYRRQSHDDDMPNLIAEVRRQRKLLQDLANYASLAYDGLGSAESYLDSLQQALKAERLPE